ncbi:MAG: tetratricopeptide repeat protein [Xanthobacteraceae bacterium]
MVNEPRQSRTLEGAGIALQRAVSALNNGRPNEAEWIAGEVLKTHPRDGQALHILGYALLIQGRAQEAITPLEAAARIRHDPEINTQLAAALRQLGRIDDALHRLRRAIKRQPPHAAAFHELGCALASVKRFDEAAEAFSRGREIAPMVAEFSVQLGRVHLERRDFAGAKLAFARALEISPGAHAALFGLAKTHQDAGEYRTAVEYFRRCLGSRPDPGILLNLGRCLLRLGQLDEGYECLRCAVRSDPQRYGSALGMLVKSTRGRFWLKPSAATQFLHGR